MERLIDEFLLHLRHERGAAENTQATYSAVLRRLADWATRRRIRNWKEFTLADLTEFLSEEKERPVVKRKGAKPHEPSVSTLYLVIAALKAFFKFFKVNKIFKSVVAVFFKA